MRAASLGGQRCWINQHAQACATKQILQFLEVALRMRQKMSFPTLLLLAYGPCEVNQGVIIHTLCSNQVPMLIA